MYNVPTFAEARNAGFVFDSAKDWILPENRSRLAQDAALSTVASTAIPTAITAYISPEVISVMTAPRNARLLAPEVKRGDWSNPFFMFPIRENTGTSEAYTDYANGTTSGVNYEFQSRKQYVFQTSITYGDREVDVTALAKLDLIADKQRAAAETLERDANKFALLGVEGQPIYGLLNDPNLPASTAVNTWVGMGSDVIYNSIVNDLFGKLVERSQGYVTETSTLKLVVSPAVSRLLGQKNQYGLSVKEMLNEYFTNLTVVVIPECASLTAGDTCFMIADNIFGNTAELPFGDKLRMGRVIPEESSYHQKLVSSTYGGVVYYPMLVASITGMDATA